MKIGILLGDDIGLEVVPEAVKVMKAAAGKTGLEIDWRPLPIGRSAHETHGHTVPASTVEALRSADGWVLGPMGHNAYKDVDIVFLREVTEGMQSSGVVVAGSGEFRPNDDISIGMRVVTRRGANRVACEAYWSGWAASTTSRRRSRRPS